MDMVAGMAAGVDLALALLPLRSSAAHWLVRTTATARTMDITGRIGITDTGIMGRGGITGTAGGDGIIGRGITGTVGGATGVGIAGTTGGAGNTAPGLALRRFSISAQTCRRPHRHSRYSPNKSRPER